MAIDFNGVERSVNETLRAQGFTIAANALRPLQRIDFSKLISIRDHEERFLKTVLLKSLSEANRARVAAGKGVPAITLQDVRTAMLMVGAAAEHAPKQQFSQKAKDIIRRNCPYCA